MKKTKVFLSALLMAAVFSFTACSNASSGSGNNGGDSTPPAPTYSVTIEASTNGTVSASKTSDISAGETITLTVTPAVTVDDDYKLGTLSVKNGDADVAVTNNAFTMPSGNVKVTATFDAIVYYGTKKPSKAKEVGDIVFNDGSAMAYTAFESLDEDAKTAKKAAAIALIFYKGTGLNSDAADGTPDTTTSRTLGVGLKHDRNKPAWCLDSANAYSKNITTIKCPASGSAGAFTFTGDKDGSNNLEQIKTFLSAEGSGTTDDTGTAANYPAFDFTKNYSATATNLGTAYASGWYLPSLAELFQIYANGKGADKVFDIDAASQALGGDKFKVEWYWSSSPHTSNPRYACVIAFENGDWGGVTKNDAGQSYVCAIRAFN